MDSICVIGYGTVGKAFADVFGIKKIYTRTQSESNITLKDSAQCRFIFICLPTPVKEDGSYYVEGIKNIIRQINSYPGTPIYVIRSTVYPGFAKEIQFELGTRRILSNPEFLSEDTSVEDTKNAPFILIGGVDKKYMDDLKAFYEGRIKGSPVILTDNTTAEMAKLTLNAFFATKVIFANQAYDACQKNGANYETVKKVLENHPYGSENHFQIWYKEKRGVNGSCLPKDSHAYAYYTASILIQKVIELNEQYT